MSLDAALLAALSQCLSDPRAGEDGLRQLAAQPVTLKSYMDSNWSPKSDRFVGPEPPEQIKTWVRANILQGLADPSTSIRVSLAYAVSKIAHLDWPDSWSSLFDDLMACLRSGVASQVHGAMRVLAEFVRDDITDQQFPAVAPILLPELFAIFSNSQAFQPRIRAKAVVIMRDFIEMIFMVKEEHPDAVTNYLVPLLAMWMDAFKAVLAADYSVALLPIKNEVIRRLYFAAQTIVKIARGFPKQAAPHMAELMGLVWSDLVRFSEQYDADYIAPLAEDFHGHDGEQVDSDGEVLGLQPILFALIEFVQLAVRKKSLKTMFLSAPPAGSNIPGAEQKSFLWQFISLSLRYMRITTEMEINWARDMNQFIQDDEDETLTFNMRVAIEEIFITLIDSYRHESLAALCEATTQMFQQCQQAHDAGVHSWWKGTEAALLALGRAQVELVDEIQEGKLSYDIGGLFNHVVLKAMGSFGHPFLQGRALWFASQFAEVLPKQLVSDYVQGAVMAVSQDGVEAAVRVCALKAIRKFASTMPQAELAPYQAQIIQGIIALSPSASDDSLALLMETLVFVVKASQRIDQAVTDSFEHAISTLVLDVMSRAASDLVMIDTIQDLISTMAASKSTAFQERMLPHLAKGISQETLQQSPETTTLTLIETMLRKVPDPFPSIYVTELFPRTVHLVLVAGDSALLQNGGEVIKLLVQRDFAGLSAWTDGTTSGIEYTMRFIAKLLDPAQSESAAVFVGELVTKLIQKARLRACFCTSILSPADTTNRIDMWPQSGDALLPVLPELLHAVVRRLESARMPTFVQTLVIVFAHLIQAQTETVVQFLCECTVNGKDGLSILVNAWCDNFQDFHGAYANKISCTALAKLLSSANPRLDTLEVRGDLIVPPAEQKRLTRSMSKTAPDQYTSVTFRAKALQLLLREHKHQIELQNRKPKSKMPDEHILDEHGDWDEDDDDDHDLDDGEDIDDEDWDDEDNGGGKAGFDFSLLSDFMFTTGDDEDEDEADDADVAADPVFHLDLRVFIEQFVRDAAAHNPAGFNALAGSLNSAEQQRLHAILSAPQQQQQQQQQQ
ncbi:hypothetical protein HK105_204113 [Polyrhizophydium stewartii]|uniref:Importin N-terminal domain-containing protein n=1 Tax=Polyrhizophydium stewartii TaxID=2732419 RepID=A0ABR4NA04_9FUNG